MGSWMSPAWSCSIRIGTSSTVSMKSATSRMEIGEWRIFKERIMLAQHGMAVGSAGCSVLAALLDVVFHILNDDWMHFDRGKGYVGLEKAD